MPTAKTDQTGLMTRLSEVSFYWFCHKAAHIPNRCIEPSTHNLARLATNNTWRKVLTQGATKLEFTHVSTLHFMSSEDTRWTFSRLKRFNKPTLYHLVLTNVRSKAVLSLLETTSVFPAVQTYFHYETQTNCHAIQEIQRRNCYEKNNWNP